MCLIYSWWLFLPENGKHISRRTTKPTEWHVRPAKTQISLGIRPVWLESSLCAQKVVKGPMFLHADSEDYDQTGRMPRLIWVFTGRTCHCVGFVTRQLISSKLNMTRYWIEMSEMGRYSVGLCQWINRVSITVLIASAQSRHSLRCSHTWSGVLSDI